jgi:hypothetical protein
MRHSVFRVAALCVQSRGTRFAPPLTVTVTSAAYAATAVSCRVRDFFLRVFCVFIMFRSSYFTEKIYTCASFETMVFIIANFPNKAPELSEF